MFAEENSKLISSLYKAKKRQEISEILEYMGESGNPVFIYPILDGYAKYRNSSVGYYFIWSLSRLDSPSLGDHLNNLLESYEVQRGHIPLVLFFMAEKRFFSETANKMASMYLDNYEDTSFRKDFNLKSLELNCIMVYSYWADILKNHEQTLRRLIFNTNLSEGERALALNYLLEIDTDRQINFLIDNYAEKIRGRNIENNLARKLLVCQCGKPSVLKETIMGSGQEKAKSILSESGGKNKKEGNLLVYNNIRTIARIAILRRQINNKTLSSENIGFNIFPENELLVRQSQCLNEKNFFISMCKDLISIINSLDERIEDHKLSEKRMFDILVDIPEKKIDIPLGKLFLYLNAKGAGVDYYFYGFWQLEDLLEGLVAQKEDDEFFSNLKHFGIEKMYKEKQWHKINCYVLGYYMQILERVNRDFNQLIDQDVC
ncbi:MAG: hypothetical protein PHI66_02875 [Candidatus Pacebacteria bacterium]|nr:hypothetical protein [Candidatus Paceibacterota bacterium]